MDAQTQGAKMSNVALVVGGTGMAACEILPQLGSSDDWSDVILLTSTTIFPNTFKTNQKFSVLRGASLDDKASLVEGLRRINRKVTHVFWFLEANKPSQIRHIIPLRRLVKICTSDAVQPVVQSLIELAPRSLTKYLYRTQARMAGSGPSKRNEAWLENMLFALDELQCPLQNFCLGTGGKHYVSTTK